MSCPETQYSFERFSIRMNIIRVGFALRVPVGEKLDGITSYVHPVCAMLFTVSILSLSPYIQSIAIVVYVGAHDLYMYTA